MQIDIINHPIQFHLHGLSSFVDNRPYGEVGCRLMDQMWNIVKDAKLNNTGTNHWTYLPGDRMHVGIEVTNPNNVTAPDHCEE